MIALMLAIFLAWYLYNKVPYGDKVVAVIALLLLLKILGFLSFSGPLVIF